MLEKQHMLRFKPSGEVLDPHTETLQTLFLDGRFLSCNKQPQTSESAGWSEPRSLNIERGDDKRRVELSGEEMVQSQKDLSRRCGCNGTQSCRGRREEKMESWPPSFAGDNSEGSEERRDFSRVSRRDERAGECVWTRVLWAPRGAALIKVWQNIGCRALRRTLGRSITRKEKTQRGRSTTASKTHKWATGKADRTRMIDFPAFCSVALPAAVYRTQTKEKHGKITYSLAEAIFYS